MVWARNYEGQSPDAAKVGTRVSRKTHGTVELAMLATNAMKDAGAKQARGKRASPTQPRDEWTQAGACRFVRVGTETTTQFDQGIFGQTHIAVPIPDWELTPNQSCKAIGGLVVDPGCADDPRRSNLSSKRWYGQGPYRRVFVTRRHDTS